MYKANSPLTRAVLLRAARLRPILCFPTPSRRKRTKLHNVDCSKSFYRSNSKLQNSRSGLQFCSRACKEKCQQIIGGLEEIWPDHYGSKEEKYRSKALSAHPHKCIDCSYSIVSILEIHHLDRDRKNSDIDNLVIICPTHHKERHRGIRVNTDYNGIVIAMK